MKIGSLFSGVGGLELGLEWAGVGHTVWQVEQDPYCLQVLARHWPNAERFTDVREVGAHNLPPVDVLCGGFPCQDISDAGKRAGIDGARSGLWFEYARIVRELRPRFVVVENVRALLVRGLDRVLGELADAGYDAEWDVLSAAQVGAPHLRNRVFLIAWRTSRTVPDTERNGLRIEREWGRKQRGESWPAEPGNDGDERHVAVTDEPRSQGLRQEWAGPERSDSDGHTRPSRVGVGPGRQWWATEPDVGRVAHGVPARVDRLRALGNAVVPQCAEVIGRRLLALARPSSAPPTAGLPHTEGNR